jgi:DNA-binding MarR family transcriptional regulator
MDSTIRAADYRALAEVRYHIRRFLNFSEARARAVGLEPQQHQLLLAIHGLPVGELATIGRIAERLQLHHNSAVELANRSVARGLVTKRASLRDRREVLLKLTARGKRLLEKLAVAHRSELRAVAPALAAALWTVVEAGLT